MGDWVVLLESLLDLRRLNGMDGVRYVGNGVIVGEKERRMFFLDRMVGR